MVQYTIYDFYEVLSVLLGVVLFRLPSVEIRSADSLMRDWIRPSAVRFLIEISFVSVACLLLWDYQKRKFACIRSSMTYTNVSFKIKIHYNATLVVHLKARLLVVPVT